MSSRQNVTVVIALGGYGQSVVFEISLWNSE